SSAPAAAPSAPDSLSLHTLFRSKHVWHVKRWSLHTKLTLVTTVLLFFAGAAVLLLLEYDNPRTFGSMDAADTTFQAFFHRAEGADRKSTRLNSTHVTISYAVRAL